MEINVDIDKIYKPSEDVVAREIQGEFILIPVTSGMADSDEEIFTLNETGKAIWDKLNSKKSLKEVISDLSLDFEGPAEEIKKDVLGLLEELFKRKMVVELKLL